jgi:HPt (histidine-containing phosphotransfer) domain-containing protein
MSGNSQETIQNIINYEELLARCLGNVDIAEKVLSKFQDRFGVDLAELERGLDAGDPQAIALTAHRIKGASANVAAPALYEVAAGLEELGRSERLAEVPAGVAQLRGEWTRFVQSVSQLPLSPGFSS